MRSVGRNCLDLGGLVLRCFPLPKATDGWTRHPFHLHNYATNFLVYCNLSFGLRSFCLPYTICVCVWVWQKPGISHFLPIFETDKKTLSNTRTHTHSQKTCMLAINRSRRLLRVPINTPLIAWLGVQLNLDPWKDTHTGYFGSWSSRVLLAFWAFFKFLSPIIIHKWWGDERWKMVDCRWCRPTTGETVGQDEKWRDKNNYILASYFSSVESNKQSFLDKDMVGRGKWDSFDDEGARGQEHFCKKFKVIVQGIHRVKLHERKYWTSKMDTLHFENIFGIF